MSLGIAFKGPEGIVLATDSRVTIQTETSGPHGKEIFPCTFDNATKLLKVRDQDYIGVVTYGLGGFGLEDARTAHGFLPEFEKELMVNKAGRLPVLEFSKRFSKFFEEQWTKRMPEDYSGPDMVFLIGGYDKDDAYGKIFKVAIPSQPTPEEHNPGVFGATWGGQLEFTNRLIKGFDPKLPSIAQNFLGLSDEKRDAFRDHLEASLPSEIPYPFLPLQDCVDLSIFLIRTTIEIQNWMITVRGTGGTIDVATITRTDGFNIVQSKEILGQRLVTIKPLMEK